MYVRDIMTTNVITVASNTTVIEASEIMRVHRFSRLPVVDRGKLVGIVTRDKLLRVSPSPANSVNVPELIYLLSKKMVKDVMITHLVTANPGMTVEHAVALAQSNRVGSLPVLEDDRIVGIVTTNDFFYKILNPLLGIGEPGTRIKVHGCVEAKDIQKVAEVLGKHNPRVITVGYLPHPEHGIRDLTIHFESENVSKIIEELSALGYLVEVRER